MFKGMKKIISVVMAAAMAVTTIAPSASITANAATTLKSAIDDDWDFKMPAESGNSLTELVDDATVSHSKNLTETASSDGMKWAKKYIKDKSGKQYSIECAGSLTLSTKDKVTKYWVKYSNVTLDGSGKKYDLKVSAWAYNDLATTSKKKRIAFIHNYPGSILYSGAKRLKVEYELTDHGKGTLANNWEGYMGFDDIDSWQALEIETPGRVQKAHLGSALTQGLPTGDGDRLHNMDATSANGVICKNGYNNQSKHDKEIAKYQLNLWTKLTSTHNKMKITYYTGGSEKDKWQGETPSADKDDKYASEPVYLGFNQIGGSVPKYIFSATKTVNDKTEATLKNTSETFTYKVKSCEIGNAVGDVMKKFTLTDTMEKVLEPSGDVKVYRYNGVAGSGTTRERDVTNLFDVSAEQNANGCYVIRAAMKAEYRSNSHMTGYFVMEWKAKIKDGADLSAYDKDGDGVAVIPNSGALYTRQKGSDADTVAKTNVVNVKVAMEAELSIDKVVNKYEHKVGDDVKFTLTVNETGKKTAANNVVVTDTTPSEYKVLKETQKGVEFMCREMEQIYSNQ